MMGKAHDQKRFTPKLHIKKGDNVITRGGIRGKVVGFTDEDKTVIVKVDDNVKLNLDKAAVEMVVPTGKPVDK